MSNEPIKSKSQLRRLVTMEPEYVINEYMRMREALEESVVLLGLVVKYLSKEPLDLKCLIAPDKTEVIGLDDAALEVLKKARKLLLLPDDETDRGRLRERG